MKGIIIKDCLNCPFSDIENLENNGGTLVCELGKTPNQETKEVLCSMLYGDYTIPIWCRLDDLQEVVDIAALDHYIKYRDTRCPECGSIEYFQPEDIKEDGLYSILECKNCHARWWSD